MKFFGFIILCFAFLLVAAVKSSEAQDNQQQLEESFPSLLAENIDANEGQQSLNRQKRLTCSIDPKLCAAHCRVKGYRRSYCNRQKVCVCRR